MLHSMSASMEQGTQKKKNVLHSSPLVGLPPPNLQLEVGGAQRSQEGQIWASLCPPERRL